LFKPQLHDVGTGAGQGPAVGVGGHNVADTPARQHGSQHPGAGANVERGELLLALGRLRNVGRGHQLEVFTPKR
jgi:hypothetical protein